MNDELGSNFEVGGHGVIEVRHTQTSAGRDMR
jgi:hypothetical protein